MSEDIAKFDVDSFFVIVVLSGGTQKFVGLDKESGTPFIVNNIRDAILIPDEKSANDHWEKIRNDSTILPYDISVVAKAVTSVELIGLKKAETMKRADAIAKLTSYEKKILGVE